MKGFTLIETALIIFIAAILTGISLKFTTFSEDTLYLKNFLYKLGSNINLIKDFSLSKREISGLKACGYGILFSDRNYLGYAFATSSFLDCDLIASAMPTAYAPSSPMIYIHTNGDVREDPIPPLQIKDKFKTDLNLKISLNNNCPDNLINFYQSVALIYYNPYGDVLLLGQNGNSWINILPTDWQNIYFCLQYKNESRFLRINRSGQMLIL